MFLVDRRQNTCYKTTFHIHPVDSINNCYICCERKKDLQDLTKPLTTNPSHHLFSFYISSSYPPSPFTISTALVIPPLYLLSTLHSSNTDYLNFASQSSPFPSKSSVDFSSTFGYFLPFRALIDNKKLLLYLTRSLLECVASPHLIFNCGKGGGGDCRKSGFVVTCQPLSQSNIRLLMKLSVLDCHSGGSEDQIREVLRTAVMRNMLCNIILLLFAVL